jgi:hypothetical protein
MWAVISTFRLTWRHSQWCEILVWTRTVIVSTGTVILAAAMLNLG